MSSDGQATLHVEWDGGGLAASADQAPLVIGRAAEAQVQISDKSVSRQHLEVVVDDGRWAVVDRSSHGTYGADGNRVERLPVGSEGLTLHLGSPDGPAVRLVTVVSAQDNQSSVPVVPPIAVGAAWTVATNDPSLRLEVNGQKYLFSPPGRVVVGRDPQCDVVCDSELVSRQHVAFTSPDPKGWWMQDLRSSRGTFVDGKRLRKSVPVRGAFVTMLGDDDAGERLQVVTAGTHRKPRNRLPLVAGAVAVVVAAVVALVAVVVIPGPDPEVANTSEQLDLAARSTVHITALDENEEVMGWAGSGVVLDSEGLIITNAHVAAPTTWGTRTEGDPALYGISVVDDLSESAEPRYLAEPVAVHPTVDAALIRIVADETGEPTDQIDTGVLPIGDSGELTSGTHANQLGFPGITRSDEVSIAEVTIQNFAALRTCTEIADNDPELVGTSCSDSEPVEDGLMNFTGADLGGGSSGGPFVRHGELVALNVGVLLGEAEFQEYAISIHTIRDWLVQNGAPA